MSWEAVAGIAAIVTVSLVVAGIVFASGRMVASVDQVRSELTRLGNQVTGMRQDLQKQGQLASSLQHAVSALDSRVGHMERVVEEVAAAKPLASKRTSTRTTKRRSR